MQVSTYRECVGWENHPTHPRRKSCRFYVGWTRRIWIKSEGLVGNMFLLNRRRRWGCGARKKTHGIGIRGGKYGDAWLSGIATVRSFRDEQWRQSQHWANAQRAQEGDLNTQRKFGPATPSVQHTQRLKSQIMILSGVKVQCRTGVRTWTAGVLNQTQSSVQSLEILLNGTHGGLRNWYCGWTLSVQTRSNHCNTH